MDSNKKKRGKVLSVCLEEQRSEFLKYEDHLKDENQLPSSSSKVFHDISKQLSFRMTAKALYVSLKRNFNYFFGEKIDNQDRDEESDKDSGSSASADKRSTSSSSPDYETSINTIYLDVESSVWEQIKPVSRLIARHDKKKHLSNIKREQTYQKANGPT